ncbi:hypothetical protein WJX79_006114 [Trebouxia sp. C0005]
MAAGRGKGDPMAGLLSGLGGIDPNLFNKPTMGQLKNKQQSPAVPPKPVIHSSRPDTIAAVGSPVRSEAGPSDSFSSQRSPATKTNPERPGAVADDLDSLFGSAKPSAAPSNAGSTPAQMMDCLVTFKAIKDQLVMHSTKRTATPSAHLQGPLSPNDRTCFPLDHQSQSPAMGSPLKARAVPHCPAGSPGTSASPLSSLGRPQRTPSLRARRTSDDGRASRKGPLEEGASPAAEAASGGRHPDPYMHEDPYMGGGQSSGRVQGSGNVEQTAKQWLTGGQKWLKSAGKKLATVAKESASEIQKRLETVDVKMQKGKGMRVGDDGEEVPAYYHQWAAKIQDMSPARQADVLDQLGEEDRLIVQRILDHAAVQRSNDSAMSGIFHSQRSRTRPVSPTGSDSSPPPPPYPGAAGTSRTGNSRPSTRPASPQAERPGDSRKAAQAEPVGSSAGSVSARGQTSAQQKPKSAADLGIFDFESQSSAELEETRAESRAAGSRAAESRVAEAEPVTAAPQRTSAPAQHSQQRPQQPAPIEADFLGFGSSQEAAEETFMPDSPPADSSQGSVVNAGAGAGHKAVPKPVPKAAPASMIDFGDEAKLLAENPDLYKGLEEVAGEPAYRKELREKRLREMHQRMQTQLAEKLARDAAESSEKEEKVDLRGRIVKPRIDAWTQGKKDNIRALLSTLHTVLWEGSGWNPPGMTDLVETGKVKKQYMKANLIIHPDKVKQKGGTVEQIVIADMAFDVLKTAWAKFESGELRK